MAKKPDFSGIVGKKKKVSAEEKEYSNFMAKPKKAREKAGKGFDFKQVTSQIKKKAPVADKLVKPKPFAKKISLTIKKKAVGIGIKRIKTGIRAIEKE